MDVAHAGLLAAGGGPAPPIWAILPFVAILLAIAILPLIRVTEHWWHKNSNKLLISALLAAVTLLYYQFRESGYHGAAPGLASVGKVLEHAILAEYVPFIILLFALYAIAGGILIRGDVQATPLDNTLILAVGTVLASFIGTTGASMLLIRLLLATNSERKHVVHTVVFFIFLVSNVGGSLLPVGDPPLLLGYLRGVPFFWVLNLWKEWLLTSVILLAVYYVWDSWAYRRESPAAIRADKTLIQAIQIRGWINALWLVLVVAAVATLDASKPLPGTSIRIPFLREAVLLALVAASLLTTPRGLRAANQFGYGAILEVACLFIGIFITMQTPLELLHAVAPTLADRGFTQPWQYFWATGILSSFLDNAPTYIVFFETANQLTHAPGPGILRLLDGNYIREDLLVAISCGAVFMGANTYIGNGPNFMVKAIAEQSGVRMPSFFGYMAYSGAILIPIFLVLTLVFFRPAAGG